MKAIAFSLHTQQPLLTTSFQGDPNSDVSYPYVPGSTIRGALIGRYMKLHHLSDLDLTSDEVRRLFFDGNSTRYLNAYLLSYEEKRTLPIPRSWFKDKDAELADEAPEITVYDFSLEKQELDSPKLVKDSFWTTEGGYIRFYKEKRRINIHNQRDRKKGRSQEGQGKIFRYDALDTGQTFQAIILLEDADEVTIRKLLEPADLWLGGSQSAGYGHTKVSDVELHNMWKEVGVTHEKRVNRENLSIILLSDMILRDKWGQYVAMPPSILLQQDPTVAAPLTQILEDKLRIKLRPKASFASNTTVGGFNRKWGLPLPQVQALAAGSVFVFDIEEGQLESEQVRILEVEGIGERREEGFGRLAVNWLEETNFQPQLPALPSTFNQLLLSEASRSIALQMAEKLLHQKLEQQLQKQVGRLTLQDSITNSQLSRLRLVAQQALPTGDCNLVISLLDDLPSNASNELERTKINSRSFKQQLYEWLRAPGCWISNPQELDVSIGDVKRGLADEFAKENKLAEKYTLRLIMAVAKKATKEKDR